uniref:DNA damage regulated autophagy modulator 1 n=1 Tax=Monodelphis domestica TaxID=13616 RepID=F7G510_MONDO
MLCFLKGMAFVPFLLVTWSSAAFIISYVIAVLCGHVNPFLPYISDTGTTPPESGIFGFMINFSAFLGAATMYTRYKIVEKQNQTCYFGSPIVNLVSLVLGLVGCIGMGIVANFQELTVPVVHDGGALLAFVCGVIYTLLQSVISYKSCPQWNRLSTCHIRMAISTVSCAAVIPSILLGRSNTVLPKRALCLDTEKKQVVKAGSPATQSDLEWSHFQSFIDFES